MARRPMTPARRKRRTIRMAIALPILLAVLVLVSGLPRFSPPGRPSGPPRSGTSSAQGKCSPPSTFHAATISSNSVSPTATTSCGGGTGMPGAV